MTRFTISDLPLPELKRVHRHRLGDTRGFLTRLFCAEDLLDIGWEKPVSQLNHTYTATKGTVRGMHFQLPPHSEMKLVSCIRGEVWDVAVDLRQNSPTFLKWHAEHLSADNNNALLIPQGFAHGFQTLSDNVELLYCHSAPFNASAEAGLDVRDERLEISWPLMITELSERDQNFPLLDSRYRGIVI